MTVLAETALQRKARNRALSKMLILKAIRDRVAHTTADVWEHVIDDKRTLRVRHVLVDRWRVSIRERTKTTVVVLISREARSAERAATVARWMLTKYTGGVTSRNSRGR